jgi:GT2 family glycosyltransferase
MLASVIIVSYNSRAHLEGCLESVCAPLPPGCEVIVVDNASSDGSAEAVEGAFPQVCLLRTAQNLGYGGGNNLGASAAQGEYLAFLNPDTVVEPGWLEALIAALKADPQAGLATSKILLLREPGKINTCGNDIHISGLTLCRGAGRAREAYPEIEEVNAVSGAAFLIRRALFETLGGFDPAFFMYLEDTDLSLRARLAGWRCLYVPGSVVYHDYTLRFGPCKTFYQERNRYMILLKNLRPRSLLALAPALLLAELVVWGFVLLRRPDQARGKLEAYAWVVRHWGEIRQARRRAKGLRKICDRDLLSAHVSRLDFEQASTGIFPRLAYIVFNPLFSVLRQLALVFRPV